MQLTINIDLEAAIADALTPAKLGPILDKHITDALRSAISDATGYDSPFRKVLKEQVAGALPHGLALDDVAKFQYVLNGALQSAVHGANAETVATALAEAAKSVMPDVPRVVKLSELIKDARQGLNIFNDHEPFFALYEPSEYGGGGHLYLNRELLKKTFGTKSKYDAECQLAFTGDGEVYSLRQRGKQITPAARPDVISKFDGVLLSMYVGRTRLEVDIDAYDVEYAASGSSDD